MNGSRRKLQTWAEGVPAFQAGGGDTRKPPPDCKIFQQETAIHNE
jgi:hypothetical protein